MDALGGLIARLGLLAVFLGAAVEGDLTAILTGILVHVGYFELAEAFAAVALGGFVGDLTCYGIGRHRSTAIRGSRLYRHAAPVVDRFVRRLGPAQILLARFLYGTRVATMIFWGVEHLPVWRFALIDLFGCALWAAALGGLGYVLGGSAEALWGDFRRVIAVLLVAALTILLSVHWMRRRRAN